MKTTGYCYHSVNVITFGLAQSDHIKRLLLYRIKTLSTLFLAGKLSNLVYWPFLVERKSISMLSNISKCTLPPSCHPRYLSPVLSLNKSRLHDWDFFEKYLV